MASLRATLGRRIHDLRKAANLTQEQLARKADIDFKYLADVEHGRKSPSLEVLEKLMASLDAEPFELFSFSLAVQKSTSDPGEQAIGDLVKRTSPAARRLIVHLLKGVSRWERSGK